MMNKATPPSDGRHTNQGMTLTELLVSSVLLSVVVMAYCASLTTGVKQRDESGAQYQALSALRSVAAEVQELANRNQDVANGIGIGALYSIYHETTLYEGELTNQSVTFTCFANEATVPEEFGGPQDLNLDGDADDDASASNGIDLLVVPMHIELTYELFGETYTVEQRRLFTRTRN